MRDPLLGLSVPFERLLDGCLVGTDLHWLVAKRQDGWAYGRLRQRCWLAGQPGLCGHLFVLFANARRLRDLAIHFQWVLGSARGVSLRLEDGVRRSSGRLDWHLDLGDSHMLVGDVQRLRCGVKVLPCCVLH